MTESNVGFVVNCDKLVDGSLPLASLGNTTFLEFLLGRISKTFPDVPKVFATGFWEMQLLNDDLRKMVESQGFRFFIGDREYGARLLRVAREYGFDDVIDIDALHPLTVFDYVAGLVEKHRESGAGLTLCHNLPQTLTPKVANREALSLYHSMRNTGMAAHYGLKTAAEDAGSYSAFMAGNPELFALGFFEVPLRWPGAGFDPFSEDYLSLRLDSRENFAPLRTLVYTLAKEDISAEDVIDYMLIKAMRRNWDQEQMFDTRYTVVDQSHMGTTQAFDESARSEANGFVVEDHVFTGTGDLGKKKILEVGCGIGRLMAVLSETFGEVHGCDASPQRYLEARYRLKDKANVTVTQADGRSLNQYSDESFDYVFAHGLFVHINSKSVINNYISEMGRVLKRGGRAKFDIYHGREVFGIGPRYFGIGARYGEDEITDIVERSGMKVAAIDYLHHVQFERGHDIEHCRMKLQQMKVICEKMD